MATAPTSVDGKQVVRALKRAERAHREAARSVAQFIDHLEGLGFKFEVVETEKEVTANHGKDRSKDRRD